MAGKVGGLRENEGIILLASKARTATEASLDHTNLCSNKGAILTINVSDMTGAPALTPKLQIKDPASGVYMDIWTAAAPITAIGKYPYLFGLGGAGSAGNYIEAVNILLGEIFRLEMGHADTDEAIYSAGLTLLS